MICSGRWIVVRIWAVLRIRFPAEFVVVLIAASCVALLFDAFGGWIRLRLLCSEYSLESATPLLCLDGADAWL